MLPLGVLTVSALLALNIVVFGRLLADRSSDEVAQRAPEEQAASCSGALSTDYACHQDRYEALVRGPGVEAAFAELESEQASDDFVGFACHQLAHVIGRTAAERYGDISGAYARGDDLCGSGYYHGAMETFVARLGADRIMQEAGTLCAGLSEQRGERSLYHRNCAHGLGHGFMAVLDNELFESLGACDSLADGWERGHCYDGLFMQNVMAGFDPEHPTRYLDADRPLYPCTDVQTPYKDACYFRQTSYALIERDNDFAAVFGLCDGAEEDFRPACYRGLGRDATARSNYAAAGTQSTCMLGRDFEARSNCIAGAVENSIRHHHDDEQARVLCGTLGPDLRAACVRATEEYNDSFRAT